VRTPDGSRLIEALAGDGVSVSRDGGPDVLEVSGLSAEQVGQAAFANRILLYELTPEQASLEEAFMSMTRDAVEFQGGGASSNRPGTGAHS
jgi:ABC-2 type transport system ATP-binding protein